MLFLKLLIQLLFVHYMLLSTEFNNHDNSNYYESHTKRTKSNEIKIS
jgi:hypothetical protein